MKPPLPLRSLAAIFAVLVLEGPPSAWAEGRSVSVLTVGNSFADNALTFLPDLARAAGEELVFAKANLGGCTLERHWNHVGHYEADPESVEGRPYGKKKQSLAQLLESRDWDFVTLQQVSFKSHDLATYRPYAEKLHAYIKERAPQATVLVHQIWAYRVDDPRFTPGNEGKEPHTQEVMFREVREAYHTIADELATGILPSGDAMFRADTDPVWGFEPDLDFDITNARPPALPDQTHSLHSGWRWDKNTLKMDGHHANLAGQYLTGCVWYETLFATSVENNPFVPQGLEKDFARFLRSTAHASVEALNAAPSAP